MYESGYKKLFGFSGTADVQDTLWAGLLCALCFSGLFAMERKGGMETVLRATPLGRRATVRAKLRQSDAAALLIAAGTALPHLGQVLRDYGLPALLSLSGMKNGIEWLGFYPLFHAAALWQTQGGNTLWVPIFLACAAFLLAWAIGQTLMDEYDMLGVPDEVL